MNYKYIYHFEKDRFKSFWEKDIIKKDSLSIYIEENPILLPVKPSPGMLFGKGGVLDKDLNELEYSYIIKKQNNTITMGGKYQFNNIDFLDDEFIYLGFISNHWGHFIVDFSTRLYYAEKFKQKNVFF